jgi:putative membrane protein insertion efficiency factor
MSLPGRMLLAGISAYQKVLSPLLGQRCRFAPSCSAYAAEAIARHGAARGMWLAVRRLAKCAPWHPGGYDPVPGEPVPSHPHATPPIPSVANEESSVV